MTLMLKKLRYLKNEKVSYFFQNGPAGAMPIRASIK